MLISMAGGALAAALAPCGGLEDGGGGGAEPYDPASVELTWGMV